MTCVEKILMELIDKSNEGEDSDELERERQILEEYGGRKFEMLKLKLKCLLL